MKPMNRRTLLKGGSLALIVALLASCGGGWSSNQLRIILAAAGPLIESLPLPVSLKSGLITDFTDMAGQTATLTDCLKPAPDKAAKLQCVTVYESSVETIINRGHFGQANNPRLQSVLRILRGIIASARIYYGGSPSPTGVMAAPSGPVTEESIKRQIGDLKREMKVN